MAPSATSDIDATSAPRAQEIARAGRAAEAAQGTDTVMVATGDGARVIMSTVSPASGPRPGYAGAMGLPRLGDDDAVGSQERVAQRIPRGSTSIPATGGGSIVVPGSIVGFEAVKGGDVHWINGQWLVMEARLRFSAAYPQFADLVLETSFMGSESGVLWAVCDVQFRAFTGAEDADTEDDGLARKNQLHLDKARWQFLPFDSAGNSGSGIWAASISVSLKDGDASATWQPGIWAAPIAACLAPGYKGRQTPAMVPMLAQFPLTHRGAVPESLTRLMPKEAAA